MLIEHKFSKSLATQSTRNQAGSIESRSPWALIPYAGQKEANDPTMEHYEFVVVMFGHNHLDGRISS